MSEQIYGSQALHRLRERQAAAREPERQASLLEQIPVDAEMDDATITVWNGEKFMAFDKWLAKRPVATETKADVERKLAETKVVRSEAGGQERLWDEE